MRKEARAHIHTQKKEKDTRKPSTEPDVTPSMTLNTVFQAFESIVHHLLIVKAEKKKTDFLWHEQLKKKSQCSLVVLSILTCALFLHF